MLELGMCDRFIGLPSRWLTSEMSGTCSNLLYIEEPSGSQRASPCLALRLKTAPKR